MLGKNYIEGEFENQEKYQEYQIKLAASKNSVREDESLQFALREFMTIYDDLKSMNDPDFFRNLTIGISIFSAIIYLIHIIYFGFWSGSAGMVFTGALLVVGKVLTSRKIQEVNNSYAPIPSGLINSSEVKSFAHYIEEGIDLKKLRFRLLMMMCGGTTFFVFTSLGELLLANLGVFEIFAALIFSIVFAFAVFYKENQQLKDLDYQLSEESEKI